MIVPSRGWALTWLVVGASGYLGAELCRQLLATGERVVGTYRSTPVDLPGVKAHRLDVRDRSAVRRFLARVRPSAVVGTAARYDDWVVTADGAAHLALAAAEVGARLVHVSSDAVHGGRPQPYRDDEAPTPVFPYGAAKAAAETAVRAIDPGAVVVRTSLIVGGDRSRQIRLCLDALSGRSGVALFTDEIRCPIAVQDLASAVRELARSDYAGLLNVAGPEAVSRAELGLLVARRYGLDPAGMRTATSAGSGLIRPIEVRLDSSRAAGLLATRPRPVSGLLAG